ncbi:hypothetical protein ACP70R_015041 [Stipagrostis hirtigluma subsp. patula]
MQPPRRLLRRPPPPADPPPPLHQPPRTLPLPSALVPPKKRRVLQPPRKAATPIPPPLPPPAPAAIAAAADALALPVTTPPPHPHSGELPRPADSGPSTLPLRPEAAAEKPSSAPPPTACEKPSAAPPPSAGENSSAATSTDAAVRPAATRKVRRVIRRIVTRKVPKGTIAARKAAALAAAGSLPLPGGLAADQSPIAQNAAAAEAGDKEQNAREPAGEKPGDACNAVTVCEALLGKETMGEGSLSGELTADCDALEVEKLVEKGLEIEEVETTVRRRRMETEVFVGGLNRDAKKEDVRAVLAKAGEISQVRMIMDAKTKKNKGFCFVRYREPTQAKKAIAQFRNVKICGKLCRVAALDGNDRIFLGNIDKKWKKEDIMKLLQEIGIENINVVTLKADYNNPGLNRGFAFLELETNRDAQIAYKKLSRKDVFGKGLNIRVAWAESSTNPDEKEMQKVKSIFVEGTPNSWGKAKMTEIFKKYGTIERVVLSRDLPSAKRNDFAFIHYTTREAAILCYESFGQEELSDNGSKVNIKVSLAKPVRKDSQHKEDHKFSISEEDKTKIAQSEIKLGPSSLHTPPSSSRVARTTGAKKSSITHGLLHFLINQAPWIHGQISSAPDPTQEYPHIYSGEKRPFPILGSDSSYHEGHNSRAQYESSTYVSATASYGAPPHVTAGYSPYHHASSRGLPGSNYGLTEPSSCSQMRHVGPRKPKRPRGSGH